MVVRFMKNEKHQGAMPKITFFLLACSYRAQKMLLNDCQDKALLSHDDGLIYKSYMLEFHEYKGRL